MHINGSLTMSGVTWVMDKRKIDIIRRIVDQYIAHAHPVGSVFLVEKCGLHVSSATVRNEMAALEEAGYMYQPHSSSGRVPTELGYKLYVQHLQPKAPKQKYAELIIDILENADSTDGALRAIAKKIATLSGEIVFVTIPARLGFAKQNFGGGDTCFVTGFSNLCSKPEFSDGMFMQAVSSVVDRLDEIIEEIMPYVGDGPEVWIGAENRISQECSAIVTRYSLSGHHGVMGIVGPMRMNYAGNIALLNIAKEVMMHY